MAQFSVTTHSFHSSNLFRTMSKPPADGITTKGDLKVNTVNALGNLSHVSTRLAHAITHLNDFVSEKLPDGTPKK